MRQIEKPFSETNERTSDCSSVTQGDAFSILTRKMLPISRGRVFCNSLKTNLRSPAVKYFENRLAPGKIMDKNTVATFVNHSG